MTAATSDEAIERLILADSPVAYWKLDDPNNAVSGQFKGGVLACNGIVSGIYASAPDSVPLSITGDIDIRVKAAARNWTPAAEQVFLGKWAGTQRSYLFGINTTGELSLSISTTGADAVVGDSTVATGVADGEVRWLRVVRIASTGVATFYTAAADDDADDADWTQLGAPVTISAGSSIFNSTTTLNIGANASGTERVFDGSIFRVQIRSGAEGPIAFDADFTIRPVGTTSFTEYSANGAAVTVNGKVTHDYSGNEHVGLQFNGVALQRSGATSDGARASRFDGVDDYIQFADHPDLQFIGGETITIEGFVRRGAAGAVHQLVSKGRPSGSPNVLNWGVYIKSDDRLEFFYVGGAAFRQIATTATNHFPVGQWVHFAVVYTFGATPIVFYIDGAPVATTVTGTWDGLAPDLNVLTGNIGGGQAGEYLNGWLNHIAVHRTGLSPAKIASRVNHLKSMVTVLGVVVSGTNGKWEFSAPPLAAPTIFEIAQLEINASGLGYAAPLSSTTNANEVTCDYTNNVVAGNPWRNLDDAVTINFGPNLYLTCPASGTVA